MMRNRFSWGFRPAIYVALCLLAGLAFAVGPAPDLPDPGHAPMSRAKQEQLGLLAPAARRSETGFCGFALQQNGCSVAFC